ncbi:hypothetical protein INS49_000934 [Diaporthe citri]|uniref:uncharacterized protein n=1 Tax=Diaporthe citri TaxID=83186 RepID=UPI001C7E7B08|nr:uncharacterized protein INS49_000934 [Diaporthe citri]KAG6366754.1 hypothetical protein INS49_000934 [Diaporthe citri]
MSTQTLSYVTTDVFTSTRYEGNPLAIIRMPTAQPLEQDQKQKIAREFNFSETVILHENEESYKKLEWVFDIFLTTREIPFAGHPTIGTIVYLGKVLENSGASGVINGTLLAKAGRLPFTYDTRSEVATAEVPNDSHVHQKVLEPQALRNLGVRSEVFDYMTGPAAVVSIVKGMTFGLTELSSLNALGYVAAGYQKLGTEGMDPEYALDGPCGLLFYHITEKNESVTKIRSRMILGTIEDPATGSASSALGVWLALQASRSRDAGEKVHRFEITQGVEMGRQSVIGVEITLDDKGTVEKVALSGTSVEVMRGSLGVP